MPTRIIGTPTRDVIAGDQNLADLADIIFGLAGIDTLTGRTGNDRIDGGADFDEIAGNEGDDRLLGGGGGDVIGAITRSLRLNGVITYQYSQTESGNDVIYGGGGSSNAADSDDYIAGGDGNDRIFGQLGDDVLGAVSFSNTFRIIRNGSMVDTTIDLLVGSEEGNDVIDGGEDDDFLAGGNGNDRLFGGNGNDYLGDFLYETNYTTTNGNGTIAAIGSEAGADTLDGGEGDDVLVGGQGNDRLLGGNGNDSLNGYPRINSPQPANERDTLTGGAGADRFILGTGINATTGGGAFYISSAALSRNGVGDRALITDFNTAEGDSIQLFGNAALYSIAASPFRTIPGTAIYYGAGATRNLVAIVQGESFSNFNVGFTFIPV
jgi:Ca2+-binding RTX toxin-like protein